MTRSGLLKRLTGFAVVTVGGPVFVAEAEKQWEAKRMGKAMGEIARRGVLNAASYAPISSERELERLVTQALREKRLEAIQRTANCRDAPSEAEAA